MKRLVVFAILFISLALSFCKKDNIQSPVKEERTVIVQMEVVNTTGHSVFYNQQIVR